MKKPVCITFAAPVGAGKTQIAHYVSWNLGIGVFSNDVIRNEIQAEHSTPLDHNPDEYFKRRDERIHSVLELGRSFIYDASIDRRWEEYSPIVQEAGFDTLVVSLDWSRGLWESMVVHKGYDPKSAQCNTWFAQHEDFVRKHGEVISLSLQDEHFSQRLEYTLEHIRALLK